MFLQVSHHLLIIYNASVQLYRYVMICFIPYNQIISLNYVHRDASIENRAPEVRKLCFIVLNVHQPPAVGAMPVNFPAAEQCPLA